MTEHKNTDLSQRDFENSTEQSALFTSYYILTCGVNNIKSIIHHYLQLRIDNAMQSAEDENLQQRLGDLYNELELEAKRNLLPAQTISEEQRIWLGKIIDEIENVIHEACPEMDLQSDMVIRLRDIIFKKRKLWMERGEVQKNIQRLQEKAKSITREIRAIDESILLGNFIVRKEVSNA